MPTKLAAAIAAAPGGGGGGGFTPPDIAGLQLWLRASDLALSDDDPVATWPDTSGNGRDMTQATGSLRPLFKANIANGKPAVRFDGSDDGMTSSWTPSSPLTLFCVYKPRGATNRERRVLQTGSGNDFLLGPRNSGNMHYYNGGFIGGVATTDDTTVYIHEVTQSDSTGAEYWVDGVSQGTNLGDVNWQNLTMGAVGSFAEVADADVFEVIFYSGVLSSGDRDQVRAYLEAEYGL